MLNLLNAKALLSTFTRQHHAVSTQLVRECSAIIVFRK